MPVISVTTIASTREARRTTREAGRTVALVPTMGYLHEGHLSLVRRARQEADEVWASIFVNPTQFAAGEDLDCYPRNLDRDLELLEAEGVGVVFIPETGEMYPKPPVVQVLFSGLETRLCGHTRPTHFGGVGIVVAKLFNIIQPEVAVFGQKDAQQAILIGRLAGDLDFPVRIVVAPTVREDDGLAMSSRNVFLSPEQRSAAPTIRRALLAGRDAIAAGARRPDIVVDVMARMIASENELRLDYASCVDVEKLEVPETISGPVLLAMAAYAGQTRLIDNELVQL